GSRFDVTIDPGKLDERGFKTIEEWPHPELKAKKPLDAARPVLEGISILLIEDNPDVQMLIKTTLARHGARRVEAASTGLEGVRKALSEEQDVIVVDLT